MQLTAPYGRGVTELRDPVRTSPATNDTTVVPNSRSMQALAGEAQLGGSATAAAASASSSADGGWVTTSNANQIVNVSG